MIRNVFFFIFLAIGLSAMAQTDKHERIKNSYLAAWGWVDEDGITYWANTQDPKDKDLSLPQLVERHRHFMYVLSPDIGKKAIQAAIYDAAGRQASQPEVDKFARERKTYAQINKVMVNWLREREQAGMNEYAEVIKKAYRDWHGSSPTKEQVTTYRKAPVMRYLDWYKYFRAVAFNKPLNQMNAQRTVQGTRSLLYVKDVQLELKPALVTEINAVDGMNYITLTSASNGLIGQAGSNVIFSDGGKLKLPDGNSWISTNTGNVIATGGGNVIATGGGNVISTGGGNVISTGGGN